MNTTRPVAGSCEHNDKSLDSIKIFPDHLSYCKLLKDFATLRSLVQ